MLRKRTRSHQRDQQMSHLGMFDSPSDPYCSQRTSNALFSVSGLFVALNSKGLSDSDSVRSPTSPLDFRVFSNLGSPFRSPHSPCSGGHHKTWDCGKIGLGIVDSIADESSLPGKGEAKVLRSSVSKSILLGPHMGMKSPSSSIRLNSIEAPKSLPKNIAMFPHTQNRSSLQKEGTSNVVFEIGDSSSDPESLGKMRSCSLDSCKSYFAAPVQVGSSESLASRAGSPPWSQKLGTMLHKKWTPSSSTMLAPNNEVVESPCASEIELSDEDYTCVISRGPNPKTTHIYGDRVLEGPNDIMKHCTSKEKDTGGFVPTATSPLYPSDAFLSFCYSCNKKLEGKDVYIYREKAFCSLSCRSEEILIDEEMEKTIHSSSPKRSTETDDEENVLDTGIFTSA